MTKNKKLDHDHWAVSSGNYECELCGHVEEYPIMAVYKEVKTEQGEFARKCAKRALNKYKKVFEWLADEEKKPDKSWFQVKWDLKIGKYRVMVTKEN